jgi:N-acetylneuraminate synthase
VASTIIIAEAGVNHNGSIDLALRLIDAAAEAGADMVKFQTFRSQELVSRYAAKAEYQQRTTDAAESQLEMLRRLELGVPEHERMVHHCLERGIKFLSTPFDSTSAALLVQRFGLATLKIASGEITNGPLLLQMARTGRKLILSTGMSTLGEVEAALGMLAFGFLDEERTPSSRDEFAEAFASNSGQAALQERVSLLHCTTEYPAPYADVNLRAMDTLRIAFGLPVGLSDHTPGTTVPIAAVARGAELIEKHFTLDRELPGPDHAASLEPDELASMVRQIRATEAALGDGHKRPVPSERNNINVARKCLVARTQIRVGEAFTPTNLGAKRAGGGISPLLYWDWLGKRATRDYAIDEPIER